MSLVLIDQKSIPVLSSTECCVDQHSDYTYDCEYIFLNELFQMKQFKKSQLPLIMPRISKLWILLWNRFNEAIRF